jgi:LPS-assembly lipoprotein
MRGLMRLAVLPLMLALAGCGMRPLYGTNEMSAGVSNELAAVAIAEPTTRLSQLIRNDLLSTMRPAGTAESDRYTLTIDAKSNVDKALEDDTTGITQRRTIRVNASFVLKDAATGKPVYSGKTFSHVSYDEVGHSFANLQAQTNAIERAAHEISLDIRTRLAAHFASKS